MNLEAFLAANNDLPETRNLENILRFFGVAYRVVSTAEFLAGEDCGKAKIRLLCSSDAFSEILANLEQGGQATQRWENWVHSAFVYAGPDSAILQDLLRRLTGANCAVIERIKRGVQDVMVLDHLNGFCGVIAGIRATCKTNSEVDVLTGFGSNAISIISAGDGATFVRIEYKRVAVFLCTSREIIDVEAKVTCQNFDIREHFFSAVPVVLYVKWAFAGTCWSASEINACLIIDDPVLKPSHGFVDFQELLSLMKRYNFSSNIAFIPWNWRRSTPKVVRLFRDNPQHYSLSVHGSDHTRAEFGSSDRHRLYWKAQQGLDRMRRHEAITGIRHDRVMVFPQGVFSAAAASALKHTDLIAAVNNDILSADPNPRSIAFSELWDVAVMAYDTFPIFTRRNPWEGIENFAFDALLGKPVIIVVHHDYCSDHCSRLIQFIERVNTLKCELSWRSLGEVVSRSCRHRELSPQTVEIEMYAAQLRLENRSTRPRRFLIRRRECDPPAVRQVFDSSRPIPWNWANGHIHFDVELRPGQSDTVSVAFHELAGNGFKGDTVYYRFNAMLRRYLCEIRDNYVTTAMVRLADFAK